MNDVLLEIEERRIAQLERQFAGKKRSLRKWSEMVIEGPPDRPHASDDAPDQPATDAGARQSLKGQQR